MTIQSEQQCCIEIQKKFWEYFVCSSICLLIGRVQNTLLTGCLNLALFLFAMFIRKICFVFLSATWLQLVHMSLSTLQTA